MTEATYQEHNQQEKHVRLNVPTDKQSVNTTVKTSDAVIKIAEVKFMIPAIIDFDELAM